MEFAWWDRLRQKRVEEGSKEVFNGDRLIIVKNILPVEHHQRMHRMYDFALAVSLVVGIAGISLYGFNIRQKIPITANKLGNSIIYNKIIIKFMSCN